MERQVIVGFDGSEHARDALALGALLAQARDARLVAACVYVYRSLAGAAASTDDDYERHLRAYAEASLEQATELTDLPLELVPVAARSVAEGLHRLAEARKADIVVVGSSHVGAIGRVMAGSVPERLMHGAPCAVAIAPRGYAATAPRRLATIAAAWDEITGSDLALAAAADLARAAGAELHAIHVCDAHVPPLVPRPVAAAEWNEYKRTMREQEVQALHAAAAKAGAVAETEDGETVATLTARSHELDLLVLGSRAYGPVLRVLLGSTSTKLVRQAACPLLVVPRGAVDVPRTDDPATVGAAAAQT